MVAMANFAVKSAIFHARGLNVVFPVSRVLGGSGDKMAEFISNSAILPSVLPSAVLTAASNSGPGRKKLADFAVKSAIATIRPTTANVGKRRQKQ